MNSAHGSSHSHELSTWVKPLTWTQHMGQATHMNSAHGSSHSHERKKQRSGVCLCESGTLVPNPSSQGSGMLWHTPWSRFPPSPDTWWAMVAKILPVWHHSRAGWCSQLCQWCSCTKKCACLSGVKNIIDPAPSPASVRALWWRNQLPDLVHDSQHNRAPGPPFVTVLKAKIKLLNKTSNF